MDRTLAADADMTNEESLKSAISLIFENGPFDALVLPGLTNFALQQFVCSECQKLAGAFPFVIFLDPERNADAETIISQQKLLPRFAKYVFPWVSTVTPCRRSAEWLPASCVIAPLALGTARFLRGVHELATLNPNDMAALADNDVEILMNKREDRRPVIGRYAETRLKPSAPQAFVEVPGVFRDPAPQSTGETDEKEKAAEDQIARELELRCQEMIRQYVTNGPNLWNALERTSISVLTEARSRGLIKNFHVRCDAETASWGTEDKPVVEVLIEYPKRVKEIKFSWK
ncbi:MAG: hypothetical protein IJU23_10050 [Proteobacteria bacterium]|nr:hypothetical protein [Pseudomonadota bacterium]